MEPVPGVDIKPPRREFGDLRAVRVSEHDEVHILVSGQHLDRVPSQE